jgi:hypothetical protein
MMSELTPRRSCFCRCAVAAGRWDMAVDSDDGVADDGTSSLSRSEVGRRSLRTTVLTGMAATSFAIPALASVEAAAEAQSSKTEWILEPVLAEVVQFSKPNRSRIRLFSDKI